ncbi:MAG: hypothetical protein A2498_03680 [Lentisphaerae bacterium RIFOXYC12_FULL_60_16]|nr:MAG: hypothetical protein A2498_03680 [Lentisphaerae bacterium RIFOXYC12_FULL_60_16]
MQILKQETPASAGCRTPLVLCPAFRRAAAMVEGTSGFALVEVVIALCVVTAAFVSVFALAYQSMRVVNDMKSELHAALAAESEMERIRAMPRDQFMELSPSMALDLTVLRKGKGEVRILPVNDEPGNEGIRVVSVRIAWVNRNGRAQELAFATLMANRGKERP